MLREVKMKKKLIIIGVIVILIILASFYLITKVFSETHSEHPNINKKTMEEINTLFTPPGAKLAIVPSTHSITLKQGSKSGGFAFSVRNNLNETKKFTWTIALDENYNIATKCPALNAKEANSWIILSEGSFPLAPGAKMESPELVLFSIPETAPLCVLKYKLEIRENNNIYFIANVYVTIVGK